MEVCCPSAVERPEDLAVVSLPSRSHFPGSLALPQALYGRERELDALQAAVARLAEGESALLLVSGAAGSGKSALIAAWLRHVQRMGQVHVAAASYEQGQQAAPYSALRQALTAVVCQILAADDAAIARWQAQISESLGPNGQVMVDFIPELVWLVGPQPALDELEPAAHRHRFLFTLRRFIVALAPPDHPLILAFDNLHWADEDSLELLKAVAMDTRPRALLLVGAVHREALCRPAPASPLAHTLTALEEAGENIAHLALTPLPLAAINELTAALLQVDARDTLPLAERVQRYAQGNPLVVIELLQALARAGAITRAASGPGWRWDLAAIDHLELRDDVGELLADALLDLPLPTQRLLTLGALLGTDFDLATLACVEQTSIDAVAADLQPAWQAGVLAPQALPYDAPAALHEAPSAPFIAPLVPSFPSLLAAPSSPSSPPATLRFRHDRIQEAALAGLTSRERQVLHLQIGRALLATWMISPEGHCPHGQGCCQYTGADCAANDQIFRVVHHLNAAADLLSSPAERRQLVQLNREAARRAHAAAAFDAAWTYCQQGLALLPPDAWTTDHELTLEMHIAAAEAATLSARHEAVEPLAAAAVAHGLSPLAKAKAYLPWIQSAIARNALDQAEALAVAALASTQLHLPRPGDDLKVLPKLARLRWMLRGRRLARLAELPPVTDPDLLIAGRIIAAAGQAVQRHRSPQWMALLALQGMQDTLRYGLFPTSAVGYAAFGAMLCMLDDAPGLGDVDMAFRLGQLATALAEQPEVRPYRARIAIPVQVIINHRRMHQRESLAPLLAAYQAALESGDPESAAICAASYVGCAYQLGHPLDELERQVEEYAGVIAQLRQRGIELALSMSHQAVLNLLGRTGDPLRLTGERCDEEALRAELTHSGDIGFLTQFLILKAHLAYLFHERQAVLHLVDQARPSLSSIAGFFAYPRFLALDALVVLDCWDQAERGQRRRLLRQAQANLRRLRPWARQAPMNHAHEVALIQAELARVQGRPKEAAAHYDAAIQLCQEHGWASDEPVAAERAARFYLAAGQPDQAQARLRLARAGYLHWGAQAVVAHFDAVYAEWLPIGRAEATAVAPTNGKAVEVAAAGEAAATEVATTKSGGATEAATAKGDGATEIAAAEGRVAASPAEISALLQAAQAAAVEKDLAALVQRLMAAVTEHAAAQRGVLLVPDPREDPTGLTVAGLRVEAHCLAGSPADALQAEPLLSQPPAAAAAPRRVVNFVVHSRQRLALADVAQEIPFAADPAVLARQVRSLLGLPLLQAGRLLGVLYLENLPGPDLLPIGHVDALALLGTQAALAVQNARLWEERERKEKRETRESEAENREPETLAREDIGDVERWAAAQLRQAQLHLREGHWVEANAQVDEALVSAQKAGDAAVWRTITLTFSAEFSVLPGGLQRCQAIAQQTATVAPAGDDEWQAARLAQQAMAAWLQGHLDEVLEAQRRALALAPPETTAWTTYLNDLMGLAVSAHTARRAYGLAQQVLDAQAARLRRAGSGPLRAARLHFRKARLDWLRRAASAPNSIEQARLLFMDRPDHPWAAVLAPTLAGMAALVENRFDLAEQHLRQASLIEAETPAARLLVQPTLLLAHALHAQGAIEPALEVLIPVLESCRREHTPGLVVQEGAALIPVLRLAAQQGRCGPTAAHVLSLLGVSNVARRLLLPETGIVLSPREVDVLELLAGNASNRAIAERLDVDIATVKSHITRVLAKLGVRTRYEAAERARALGLVNEW